MNTKISRLTILFVLFQILLPVELSAWSEQGHRIIGKIASDMMSCTAKKKADKVLSNTSVAMVATWGDFIKADTAYTEFSDWHYTNLPANLTRGGFDSLALDTNSGECIYRVIYLTNYLKKHPNDTDRLKLLIHIVGDMFQPLHLGRQQDLGGNTINVKWFGRNINLHSLWDSHLIDGQKLSYTEYVTHLKRIYKPKKVRYSERQVLDFAWKTYIICEKIYNTVSDTSNSYRYIYDYQKVWEQQLVEGGILLASILDYIY